jgi:hypothetical protein
MRPSTMNTLENAPPSGQNIPTKAEKLEFLKQAVSFTEGNIRAFDTKTQISMAAFVISGSPLLNILPYVLPNNSIPLILQGFGVFFIFILITCIIVLMPVTPPATEMGEAISAENLFFVRDLTAKNIKAYSANLDAAEFVNELTCEVFKLSYIRMKKNFRFKIAMVSMLVFYISVGILFGLSYFAPGIFLAMARSW